MNLILLLSSIVMGIIHLMWLFIIPNITSIPYFYASSFGIITSILNHGLTSDFLKYLDRVSLSLLVAYSLNIHYKYSLLYPFLFTTTGAVCYIAAKQTGDYRLHAMSHILATANNFLILSHMAGLPSTKL